MAYEREAIAANDSAMPTQPQMQMREERVVSPYAGGQKPSKIGQSSSNVGSTPNVSPEEPSSTPQESVSLSPAAAALARKEQKFRQEQQRLAKEREALDAERKEIAELKGIKEKLAAKDYSALEGLVPYDEYTNYQVNKLNSMSPEAQALNDLKNEVEGLKKSQQTDIEKRFEAAVNERRKAIKGLVETKPEFQRIKKAKAEEHVVQYILDTWEHDNVDLDPETAAKEVDQILQERAKKWAGLLEVSEEPVAPQDSKQLPPLKPNVTTLTNNMNVTGEIARPKRSYHGMSDAERYAEARRRAEEKLKGR